MHTYRYRVSLRIWHPTEHPDQFTTALNLPPDFIDVAGEARVRNGKTLTYIAKESYWLHSLDSDVDKDVEAFLLEKAESLSGHAQFFQKITSSGGRAEFFIGFYPVEPNCGIELSPQLLKKCSDLNLSLSFDIYALTAEPQSGA